MDPFRLILLVVGIILLALVYFFTQRTSKKPTSRRKIPIPMSGDVSPQERPYQARLEKKKLQSRKRFVSYLGPGSTSPSTTQHLYDQVSNLEPFAVTVYVMPLAGMLFRREQVVLCLESLGCVPRSDVSYDYLILDEHQGKKVNRLFTVSDVHDPGIFSYAGDAPKNTDGLVFEMQLPGPIESVIAFERLLDVARLVATKLNGVVCDDLQNKLTKQATSHIKDKIVDYNQKLRYTHSSSVQ
jgi:FtsZ-interacting cell division protein ZipA